MTPRFPRRRTALARKLVKSMVATVLVATTLFGATSAQAKLVITSALRSISAETSGSAPSSDSTAGTEDRFDQSVSSQVLLETGDGASAGAFQNTFISQQAFSGIGQTRLRLKDGHVGTAESSFSLLFTLTSSVSFTGATELNADGNALSHASFDLDALGAGGGSIVSGDDETPLLPFSGTLGPGDYSLNVRASSFSIDPNDAGSASFTFNLAFAALDAPPPSAVPEPQSLALVLAGLVAGGIPRRRRQPAT